jgi:killer suppression protein higA, putative
MEILFANSQIEKICASPERAVKKYGARCARILLDRMRQMRLAENIRELSQQSGHFHALTGERKGQWACNLLGGLRLVFVPGARGEMVLKEITYLTITEIVDYHK